MVKFFRINNAKILYDLKYEKIVIFQKKRTITSNTCKQNNWLNRFFLKSMLNIMNKNYMVDVLV